MSQNTNHNNLLLCCNVGIRIYRILRLAGFNPGNPYILKIPVQTEKEQAVGKDASNGRLAYRCFKKIQ